MRCWLREAKVIFLNGPSKCQFSLGGVDVAHDLDVAHVAAAEALLVRQADELAVAQRVEAHQLGGDGVDGHLVGRGQDARSSRAGSCSAGPGPSPAKVPSITAKTPRWIFFWIISRSTSVSWMTGWVQWRCSLSRPPKAFFIAPVVVVKTCVLTVGRWMMFSPMKRLGIEKPFG